jgi:hypothetical protein
MTVLDLGRFQLEVRRGPFAGMTIPPVGEQDAADIQKEARGRTRSFHCPYIPPIGSSPA